MYKLPLSSICIPAQNHLQNLHINRNLAALAGVYKYNLQAVEQARIRLIICLIPTSHQLNLWVATYKLE
jgi:glucose-6-phosphate isomerase